MYDLQVLWVGKDHTGKYCARCLKPIEGYMRNYLAATMDDTVAYYHMACAAHVLNRYAAFADKERERLASLDNDNA